MRDTVGSLTVQTGFEGLQLSPNANITGYIFTASIALISRSRLEFSVLQGLRQSCRHGVLVQVRCRREGSATLRAAVDTLLLLCIPAVVETTAAVAVSTGSGEWILEKNKRRLLGPTELMTEPFDLSEGLSECGAT